MLLLRFAGAYHRALEIADLEETEDGFKIIIRRLLRAYMRDADLFRDHAGIGLLRRAPAVIGEAKDVRLPRAQYRIELRLPWPAPAIFSAFS